MVNVSASFDNLESELEGKVCFICVHILSLKSFRLSNVCPDCFPAEFEVMFVVILNCPADTCITNKEITGKCRVVELLPRAVLSRSRQPVKTNPRQPQRFFVN